MSTCRVKYPSTRLDEVRWFEIRADPVDFETGAAHVELGGMLVAMKQGAPYQVFDGRFSPMFAGVWAGCTFHIVVKEL
jgi:hypothetical protein